jgi:hypothetical protein
MFFEVAPFEAFCEVLTLSFMIPDALLFKKFIEAPQRLPEVFAFNQLDPDTHQTAS